MPTSKTSKNPKDISNLINDFLQYCEVERNLSSGTVKMYHLYLKEFSEYTKRTQNSDNVNFDKITQDSVRDYRVYLNRKLSDKSTDTIKRNTQNRYLTA